MDMKLSLCILGVERDWGLAPEYVQAIAMMLEQPTPEDYIVATGRSHTLTQFVETAFRLSDKDWREYVPIDQHLVRPTDIACNKSARQKPPQDWGGKHNTTWPTS